MISSINYSHFADMISEMSGKKDSPKHTSEIRVSPSGSTETPGIDASDSVSREVSSVPD